MTNDAKTDDDDKGDLDELLHETRILLPGTEIFLSLLMTMPFTERFGHLDGIDRGVYVVTFFATLLSLVCFIVPATYHRIARPVHHKARFKVFANAFLVAGLVPMSLSLVFVGYLVGDVVMGRSFGLGAAIAIAAVVLVLWWVLPLLRAHDRYPYDVASDEAEPPSRSRSNVTSIRSRA